MDQAYKVSIIYKKDIIYRLIKALSSTYFPGYVLVIHWAASALVVSHV